MTPVHEIITPPGCKQDKSPLFEAKRELIMSSFNQGVWPPLWEVFDRVPAHLAAECPQSAPGGPGALMAGTLVHTGGCRHALRLCTKSQPLNCKNYLLL